MAKEDIKLRLPVVPELDKKGTSSLLSDIKKLERNLGKIDMSWKTIGKTASVNVKEINKISTAAGQFSKQLSTGFKDSVKELKSLGERLKNAKEQANNLAKQYSGAKGKDKSALSGQVAASAKLMKDLNVQIANQKKEVAKYTKDLSKVTKLEDRRSKLIKKNEGMLKGRAEYSPTDAIKDFLAKLKGKDVSGALKSVIKGAQGAQVRGAEEKGGAEGAAQMASVAEAAGAMSAAAASIGLFVKLVMAASDHMAGLNKALTSGIGLAQEMGGNVGQYSKAIKDLRSAAIGAAGAMLKYGLNSESALKSVNAFAKESGMSLIQMEEQLKSMGKGDLERGMKEFAINAQVYGKALGMEGQAVAGLMGQFTNEIGKSADDVTRTMGDIVKQAAQAGMPTKKFMDIFQQAIPNLDMFTNRIEELTGTMKMLSKTMDPRQVKGFMSAMGKGFDQLDFKQRLKMALIVGPGEMNRIMKDDIGRASASVKDSLKGLDLGAAFEDAMKGGGNIAKMRKVAAQAMAKGASGSVIANLNKLGRMQELSKGGVLKQASGMREMGLMGRMEALTKLAGRFTGGDISGLGEHVAKQLGVSEDEYKAILGMQDSLGDYSASIAQTGRTSSVSMNKGLAKLLTEAGLNTDETGKLIDLNDPENFEKATKKAMKKDPAGFKKMLMTAATLQIEDQQQQAKEDAKGQESIEDLTADNVSATQSLGDKIENVIGYLLEKIYWVLDDMFGSLNNLYAALPGWLSGDTQTSDIMNDNTALLTRYLGAVSGPDKDKHYQEMAESLKGIMTDKDAKSYIEALQKGDLETTGKLLKALDPKKATALVGRLAKLDAKDPHMGPSLGRGEMKTTTKSDERATKKQEQIAKTESDLDQRNRELMGGEKENSGEKVGNWTKSETPAVRQPISFERTNAPAMAAGAPQSPAQKETAATMEDHADTAEDTKKIQENIASISEDYYDTAKDTFGLLKKGLILNQSWMGTKFKNVLKEASLDSLRTALMEFAVLEEKIKGDDKFQKALSGQQGWNFAHSGARGLDRVLGADASKEGGGGVMDALHGTKPGEAIPGFATGITQVPHDMPAMLHAGESVTSSPNNNAGKGNKSKVVNVTIYAQGVPASQIAHHISNMSRSD
jgi:hypothetical protein